MMEIKSVITKHWITILFSLGLILPGPVEGFLDVFLDQHEMKTLMGLDAELFYVRHGVVNNFALSFVVPVPEQVDDLTFSWQRLVDIPIPYSISIEYESQLGGLLTPHINVPVRGHVPSAPSTFTIRLPCTGNVSEEVPVGIHLEIDGYPSFNRTKLTFKRNKICIRDENYVETSNNNNESDGQSSTPAVFKLFVFVFTFLLVSIVLLVTCYCRGSHRRHTGKAEKCHEPSPQTSYTIDESSTCSASSSLSSRRTATTTATKSTSHNPQLHYTYCRGASAAEYGNVSVPVRPPASIHYGNYSSNNRRGGVARGHASSSVVGCHRPPSVASCSSIYETIVESVNKFPMQTMHSNKTCGACCTSVFGDSTLYDGVTIAGLVLPTNLTTKSQDRQSRIPAGIYDQPDVEATIRWPAPPLFTLEDEMQQRQREQQQQRQSNEQQATTMMAIRAKQNAHCYSHDSDNGDNNRNNVVDQEKRDTRFNTAPGRAAGGGFVGNPFFGAGLLNADAAATATTESVETVTRRYNNIQGGRGGDDGKESCTYYEPTSTFVNQHL